MGNSNRAAKAIRRALSDNGKSFAWLAREADVPYKRVLAEIKEERRPLDLGTAISASHALGMELPELMDAAA